MTREDIIDILKAISKVEGIARTLEPKTEDAITAELEWISDKLTEILKNENKN